MLRALSSRYCPRATRARPSKAGREAGSWTRSPHNLRRRATMLALEREGQLEGRIGFGRRPSVAPFAATRWHDQCRRVRAP